MSSPIVHGDRVFVTTAVASSGRTSAKRWIWSILGALGVLGAIGALRIRRGTLAVGLYFAGVVVAELLINVDWRLAGERVSGSIARIWLVSGAVAACGMIAALLVARRSVTHRLPIGLLIAGAALFFTLGIPDPRQYIDYPPRYIELSLFAFGGLLGWISVNWPRRAMLAGLTMGAGLLLFVAYLHHQLDTSSMGYLRFRVFLGLVSGVTLAIVTNRVVIALCGCGGADPAGGRRGAFCDFSCAALLLMVGIQFYGCNFLLPGLGVTRRVVCLEASSGRILWEEGIVTPEEPIVTGQSLASPTPVTDGERVYAYFGNVGAIALDYDGKMLWWNQDLPLDTGLGAGSSPVLHDDLLILACDHQGPSYVVALDVHTGEVRWRTDRKTKLSFGTPMLTNFDNRPQLVVAGGELMAGYDPSSGNELWSVGTPVWEVVPSVVVNGDVIYVGGYWMGDVLSAHVMAGDAPSELWSTEKKVLGYASPVVSDTQVYVVTNQGVATCMDSRSGKVHWRERLGGNFTASPVLAEGRVHFLSREGVMTIVEDSADFTVVAKNAIDENCVASPAISGSRILLRSATHLWSIQRTGSDGSIH